MALLQPPKTLQITSNLFPICNFSAIRPSISIPFSSPKTHHRNALHSSSSTRPFSLSTTPRRILCEPPKGKYIHDDYLVKKMTAAEVHELVKGERHVPLIIDFYATWCGPCILMAQELEMSVEREIPSPYNPLTFFPAGSHRWKLAVEYENNAMIIKVDTDDEYEFSRDMQVRGLPTLFFISPDPSKEAIRTEGLIPIQMMRDIIDKEM